MLKKTTCEFYFLLFKKTLIQRVYHYIIHECSIDVELICSILQYHKYILLSSPFNNPIITYVVLSIFYRKKKLLHNMILSREDMLLLYFFKNYISKHYFHFFFQENGHFLAPGWGVVNVLLDQMN